MISKVILSDVTDSNSHYHIGNYYNWTAAIATNDSSDVDYTYDDETGDYDLEIYQSICPTGWALPTTNKFDSLISNYDYENAVIPWGNPLYFPYLDMSSNNNANFWTPEVHSEYSGYAFSYYFEFSNTAGISGSRSGDYFVRCVIRN